MPPHISSSLSDVWALVTGSSGGIGAAIARELASGGAKLILHGNRHAENAKQLAEELESQGTQTEVLVADLADPSRLKRFVDELGDIGRVEILINNAGVDVLTGAAADWTFEEKLAALWQVDVLATIELSRTLGRLMQSSGGGTIVNMGWSQAEVGMAGDSGEYFAAVKGAVMAFTRSVARSLAPQVRVNCVAPGWIQTKWGESAPDYWQDRAKQESLLKRWGRPEDVAKVVRFLTSADSDFITGQVINIDGGYAGSVDNQGWN